MHSSMPEHPQDREAEGNARSKKEGLIYQYTAKKKKKNASWNSFWHWYIWFVLSPLLL